MLEDGMECDQDMGNYERFLNQNLTKANYMTTGSVYLFAEAKKGFDKPGDWNLLEISSRKQMISVKLNGTLVCEHPGDPNRPKQGPIGLQLHDGGSVVMFRNVQIRLVK